MGGGLEIPGISCDRCGRTLLVDESVRYVVDVRVYAAYDTMEITRSDYEKDHREEIREALDACRKMSADELEDQIYREFRFHLCPPCQKRYLRDPLGTGSGPRPPETSGSGALREGPDAGPAEPGGGGMTGT